MIEDEDIPLFELAPFFSWKKLLFHHYTGSLLKLALTGSRAELFKNVSSSSQARSIVFSLELLRGSNGDHSGQTLQRALKSRLPKNHFWKYPNQLHADGGWLEFPDTYEWNLRAPACIELDTTTSRAKKSLSASMHEKYLSGFQGSLSGDTVLTSLWPLLFSSAPNIKTAIQ